MNPSFRKTCSKLHLWLGLISGIVVIVVCLTGALYAFKDEIEDATQPWRFVEAKQLPMVPPEKMLALANKAAADSLPQAITFGERIDAVRVDYWDAEGNTKAVYLNPYTGAVVKVVKHEAGDFDFFAFVLKGHRTLWLPQGIGNYIVDYGVLAFFIVLVTGLVIWLPKRWTKASAKARLTLRRPLSRKRLPIDLHNVVGFYALLPLLVLCYTGMMFGLEWFSRGVYAAASGGKELQPYEMPMSDTTVSTTKASAPINRLYAKVMHEEPNAAQYYFTLPQSPADIYRVSVVHSRGSYYRTDNLFYDRHTLAPLRGSGPWAGHYNQVSFADRMMRINLEIHDGRILGIWGKGIMTLAALVGASLPVTGFILWRRRHKPGKHK